MSKLKLSALLLGVALFMSLGTTSLLADSKCGASKCGPSAKSAKVCDECPKGKTCDKKDDCGHSEKASSKCGDAKKTAKAMKCGAGKCGGN